MANETKKPRVHVELIKAWADGAAIQRETNGEWSDCSNPLWNENVEYRIKPEPKPDFTRVIKISSVGMRNSADGFLISSGVMFLEKDKTIDQNLKLIFDGETGKLKDAKVIG